MIDIEKYNVNSQMVKASENEAFLKQLNITGNLTLTLIREAHLKEFSDKPVLITDSNCCRKFCVSPVR